MSNDPRFFAFLKERIGLDVASVGEAIIERAVRQRCQSSQSPSAEAYWQHLQTSHDEQQALIEAVIVPETWFFRYPESFATLARLAQARLAEINQMRALRILSLPCSTGEEPYSIAMALLDAGLAPHQFKVQGMDVSPLSVERARRGVYGKNSFRGADLEFRDRHFTEDAGGYRIADRVREQVRLQVGNLLDPALLANEPTYDFVFCRNLLIYFDQPTQKQVFDVLKALTHVDGVLFIGPAEGSLLGRHGMRSIGVPQSFAFSRHVEPAAPAAPVIKPTPAPLPQRRAAPIPLKPRPFSSVTPPRATGQSYAYRCRGSAQPDRNPGQRGQKCRGPSGLRAVFEQSPAGRPGVLLVGAAQRCGWQCPGGPGVLPKSSVSGTAASPGPDAPGRVARVPG
ncbi:putative chemotaxis-related methyltransferase [Pseudomonas sp. CFT9]|nr:putative chemotaxis-related methyltransferase [Pseudomonas sp. CFT9]